MPGQPLDDTSREPLGWRLYRAGPWLMVYGYGPDSEDRAKQAHTQCIDRGVDTVLCAIDEVQRHNLNRFTGLVVVLPSQPTNPAGALRSVARLIVDYRARRSEGLESILNGRFEWYDAGVVQVVGRRAIIEHSGMRTTLDRVCVRHYTDDSRPLDLFQPYSRKIVLAQQPDKKSAGEVRDERVELLWRDVQKWGVADIRDVPKLRKCIDDFREHYESQRFSQLYRPINNIPRNRLDIILDGPGDIVVGDRKTWMENGARVCREVEKELRKIVPNLTRPPGQRKKDVQYQLNRLYRNLRIIDSYLNGLNT